MREFYDFLYIRKHVKKAYIFIFFEKNIQYTTNHMSNI